MEDVALLVDALDEAAGPPRRALYAVFDGHGGRDCADWVSQRLPGLVRHELDNNATAGASANSKAGGSSSTAATVKEALRRSFALCDTELLRACDDEKWCDGCCAVTALLELDAAPPRGCVANLRDSPLLLLEHGLLVEIYCYV